MHLGSEPYQNGNHVSQEVEYLESPDLSKKRIIKEMSFDHLAKRSEELQDAFVQQMQQQLSRVVKEILQDVDETSESPSSPINIFKDDYKYSNRMKSEKKGDLPDKVFLHRNSLLTDLFEVKHIKTIYHIFVAVLIILFINTITCDFIDTGKLLLDFELILWNFGEFRTVLMMWVAMMFTTFLVYSCFTFWANNRITMVPGTQKRRIWDCTWLAVLIAYQIVFICVPVLKIFEYDLPPASSTIVLSEQVRLIMKSHAFVRSNCPRALSYKLHQGNDVRKQDDGRYEEEGPCPGFSKFLYFLFVPTLVYRDSYPRTKSTRWSVVARNFLEVVGIIFYTYFIFVRMLVPVFHRFGQEPLVYKSLVLTMFGSMLPGALVMLCAFYCLLHSWMNAFAEMLQFADRMFYKDWWNCSSFAEYYRTWNVVVHDWLYTYIYKDVSYLTGGKNRTGPMLTVFFVSAVFHEYILTVTFRFFYPILLFIFGSFGVALAFVRKGGAGGNIFMWIGLLVGNGLLMSLYSMEWYARINCPSIFDSPVIDFFVPRSWTCNAVVMNSS